MIMMGFPSIDRDIRNHNVRKYTDKAKKPLFMRTYISLILK